MNKAGERRTLARMEYRARYISGTILLWALTSGAAFEGVYECPGMPMRYTDGGDHPSCRWIELSESKLIKINPSPFAPERSGHVEESDGPLRSLDERAPIIDIKACELLEEWNNLQKPTSGNGPTEVIRRQELARLFHSGHAPACRR